MRSSLRIMTQGIIALLLIVGTLVACGDSKSENNSPNLNTPDEEIQEEVGKEGDSLATVSADAIAYVESGALDQNYKFTLKTFSTPPVDDYLPNVKLLSKRVELIFPKTVLANANPEKRLFIFAKPFSKVENAENSLMEIRIRLADGSDLLFYDYYSISDEKKQDIDILFRELQAIDEGYDLPENVRIIIQPSGLITPVDSKSEINPQSSIQINVNKGLYHVTGFNDVRYKNACKIDTSNQKIPSDMMEARNDAWNFSDKKPLILVHGWQVMSNALSAAIIRDYPDGKSSIRRKTYNLTFSPQCDWQDFIKYFFESELKEQFELYVFGYDDTYTGIPEIAQILSREVKRVFSTDEVPLTILAHSMGGLVTNTYAHTSEGKKFIEKIITLGTPYRGSIGFVCLESESGRCVKGESNPNLGAVAGVTNSFFKLLTVNIPEAQSTKDLTWDEQVIISKDYCKVRSASNKWSWVVCKKEKSIANPFLKGLNAAPHDYDKYTAFVAKVDGNFSDCLPRVDTYRCNQYIFEGIGYITDGIAPVQSAKLQQSTTLASIKIKDNRTYSDYDHSQVRGAGKPEEYISCFVVHTDADAKKRCKILSDIAGILYYPQAVNNPNNNSSHRTASNRAITINVLDNDSYLNKPVTSLEALVSIHDPPASQLGKAFINSNQTITFTPAANFNASNNPVIFTYKVAIGKSISLPATVAITVNNPQGGDPPVIRTFTVNKSTVEVGEEIVLSWDVSGVGSSKFISINDGEAFNVTDLPDQGKYKLDTAGTHKFELEARNQHGNAKKSITVIAVEHEETGAFFVNVTPDTAEVELLYLPDQGEFTPIEIFTGDKAFEDRPTGWYAVNVTAAGYSPDVVDFFVFANQTIPVDVVLIPNVAGDITVLPVEGRELKASLGKSISSNFILENTTKSPYAFTTEVSNASIIKLDKPSDTAPAESNTESKFTATCPETVGSTSYHETITYRFSNDNTAEALIRKAEITLLCEKEVVPSVRVEVVNIELRAEVNRSSIGSFKIINTGEIPAEVSISGQNTTPEVEGFTLAVGGELPMSFTMACPPK